MAKQRPPLPSAADKAADDAQAFRAAVRDVKPLAQTPLALGRTQPRPARRRRPAVTTSLDDTMPLLTAPSGAAGAAAAAGGDALAFQRAGVRNQVMRRLRRGLIPIEAELDLHGLNQAHAREHLAEFLELSHAAGRRCVRIIHGKGLRSGAGGPVLKGAVDLWLRRHLDVMAFTSARGIDGGSGAVYVLLRG